jgi:hypothetical protein
MTSRISGVQTLRAQQATNSILRIVCVPHQCDLVIKKVTNEMDDENSTKRPMHSRFICVLRPISSLK